MRRFVLAGALVVAVLGAVIVWDWDEFGSSHTRALSGVQASALYDPGCGCCGKHLEYMEQTGMLVEREMTNDLGSIKDSLGIPADLRSCHTTMIEGYIVEGHMPAEAIVKLLDERPDIRGIALPAMPSGSPGMPGDKNQTWTIYALEHDGSVSVFLEL